MVPEVAPQFVEPILIGFPSPLFYSVAGRVKMTGRPSTSAIEGFPMNPLPGRRTLIRCRTWEPRKDNLSKTALRGLPAHLGFACSRSDAGGTPIPQIHSICCFATPESEADRGFNDSAQATDPGPALARGHVDDIATA